MYFLVKTCFTGKIFVLQSDFSYNRILMIVGKNKNSYIGLGFSPVEIDRNKISIIVRICHDMFSLSKQKEPSGTTKLAFKSKTNVYTFSYMKIV